MKFLSELNENRTIAHYDAEAMNTDEGLDVYDRAISMINAAVEKHVDNFEAIADVDSLVDYLKGRHHDFSQEVEKNVRDIIADETGESEEQEEKATHFSNGTKRPDRNKDTYYNVQDNKKYQGTLKSAARIINKVKPEEEELSDLTAGRKRLADTNWNDEVDQFRKRRPADDEGRRSSSSRMRSRRRDTHTPNPFSVEQEELVKLSDRRARHDEFRADVRGKRRGGHRHADQSRAFAQLLARKARPHVGLEQEETLADRVSRYKKEDDKLIDDNRKRKMARQMALSGPSQRGRRTIGRGTGRPLGSFGLEQEEVKDDWNEEVRKFRERNKKAEPEGRPSRLRRRQRRSASEKGVFNLRFESFKTFLADETKDA